MTAKEKLSTLVNGLSENEAEAALELLAASELVDPLDQALDKAPIDDEPSDPGEEASVREALAEYRRGDFFEADEIKRELS